MNWVFGKTKCKCDIPYIYLSWILFSTKHIIQTEQEPILWIVFSRCGGLNHFNSHNWLWLNFKTFTCSPHRIYNGKRTCFSVRVSIANVRCDICFYLPCTWVRFSTGNAMTRAEFYYKESSVISNSSYLLDGLLCSSKWVSYS